MRTFLDGVVDLVAILEVPGARAGGLPAFIRHELVLDLAVLCIFRRRWIIGNGDAAANEVRELVALLDLLLIPFVRTQVRAPASLMVCPALPAPPPKMRSTASVMIKSCLRRMGLASQKISHCVGSGSWRNLEGDRRAPLGQSQFFPS